MRALIMWVIIVLIIAMVSNMEWEDEVQQQELYCRMVAEGKWGDYNANYAEICNNRGTVYPGEKESPQN